MNTARTPEACIARACRLMIMADDAADYATMLTYDALAQEWIRLAAIVSQETITPRKTAETPPVEAAETSAATPPARARRKWLWFL